MGATTLSQNLLNDKLNIWAGTEGIDYTDAEWGIAYCFKWLVPKLRGRKDYCDINLRDFPLKMGDPYLFTIRVITEYPAIKAYQGGAETPALALCLAIEKLIDDEKTKK